MGHSETKWFIKIGERASDDVAYMGNQCVIFFPISNKGLWKNFKQGTDITRSLMQKDYGAAQWEARCEVAQGGQYKIVRNDAGLNQG